ncbi:protein translocase subunit secG [Rhodothalassium salexigens DSM 2132]|uniref:Protein-export membrane protein SecG n=1 Tax=Rhodothalassium salexigens DSM 2132 TaxID=1188247 RepID=A0A4R2PQN9_RHOSA|nr:preprotein translocase subunit SecG [Rhodothalassium salexigens]MBB4209967.1 preprotein translocase subunit SecG [Rhodothalassium salexigens DSM 2132]MBK1637661.1 preprotein translocase subunit SecG [Rhodothalassium salexigens DSM 2132]TCP38132.1 protein translocase subunit secG [Rhodothalassium salexigens DSM 2132]
METILLVVHLILALALVGVILMQRSEGGALGIGGGGGGLVSARGAATLFTRLTVWLAVGFLATSMGLALIARQNTGPSSVMEQVEDQPAADKPEVPVRN